MQHSQRLDEITSQVHDLYFDVDPVPEALSDDRVRSPLYRGRSRRGPVFYSERLDSASLPPAEEVLTIRQVRSLAIDDKANIGWYSINYVSF